MTNTTPAARYQEQIRGRILDALATGPRPLVDLVRACRGAYPTVVADALADLGAAVHQVHLPAFAASSDVKSASDTPSLLSGIEGNPVLSSWYFTTEVCDRIVKLRDWSGMRLAFLGTPRLFERFCAAAVGDHRLLLDLDDVVLSALAPLEQRGNTEIRGYNAAKEVPRELAGQFDAVFFDPPWYPSEYLTWLYRAITLAPGKVVYFALFPDLTRPSAPQERDEVLTHVHEVSSSLSLISSFLEYEVPSFEQYQLGAAGFPRISAWKIADLVVAHLRPDAMVSWHADSAERAHSWVEANVGRLRIFVNPRGAEAGDILLDTAPGHSAILPSPSRRNPALRKVNVLTSHGHGLVTSEPSRLVSVLRSLEENRTTGRSVQASIRELPIDDDSRALLESVLIGANND